VKLKYVQQPMGKTAGTSNIIRPSKRIIYDTTEAVVSFLSEDVDTCVDEFLEEWARVSKMVVIAREGQFFLFPLEGPVLIFLCQHQSLQWQRIKNGMVSGCCPLTCRP
jgi:hypothetical protein